MWTKIISVSVSCLPGNRQTDRTYPFNEFPVTINTSH